ncbi:MAG: response regulator [Treponema sp.]|jgi:two-component system chemotaxis response regulator CheY|nr:response regulator [Treponema sp.]
MVFLLADDSRHTRNLLKSYVSELDLGDTPDFIEAETAENTLEMIKNRRVDFVFLDWNFNTKMTGLDVLKEIRKVDKYKHLPVVIVTSESDKANVIVALKLGANDFIVKPVDKKSFTEKTIKVINSVKYSR